MKQHINNTITEAPSSTVNEGGFTIVELMIATAVFSIVLVIITYGVIHFSSSYYRGVNTSNTQTVAQNAIDAISQAIEFSRIGDGTNVQSINDPDATHTWSTNLLTGDGSFCAGSKFFKFTLGGEYDGSTPGAGDWGLYELPETGDCAVPLSTVGGTELLSKNMRLAGLSTTTSAPLSGSWQISLIVAYGDADLLCNVHLNSSAGGCNVTDAQNPLTTPVSLLSYASGGDVVRCKTTIGSQFCAVSTMNTAIEQRIGN